MHSFTRPFPDQRSQQHDFSTFSTAASFINCINWIFDKTSNVFYHRVPQIASNILRNLLHPWEFIFTSFQALRLLKNLAFYMKHEFSAISCLHPTSSTVEWSLGYFLFISSDKYFFWIDQHAWNIILGPQFQGREIETNSVIYTQYIHTFLQTSDKSQKLLAYGTGNAAWNSLLRSLVALQQLDNDKAEIKKFTMNKVLFII